MEQGRPFCPQCVAPLIRVAVPEGAAVVVPSDAPAAAGILRPTHRFHLPGTIDWSQGLVAAALGGAIAAFFTLLGIGVIAGGAFAVFFYRRRVPFMTVTPTMGAKLGAASGAICFAILTVVTGIGVLVAGREKAWSQLLESVQQNPLRGWSDPQAQQQVLDLLKTPQGLIAFILMALALFLVGCVILAGLGGTVSAWLRRR